MECLAGLSAAADGHPLIAHVMANGCTDGTEDAVRAWAAGRGDLRLFSLRPGDKAGAWNEYVHTIRADADVHFFVDGHIRPGPRSMAHLAEALAANGTANAAGALPESGRHREAWRGQMLRNRTLAGGLYALSRRFIERIRRLDLRLPVGFLGDDTLVSYLAREDFGEPPPADQSARVIVEERAEFAFHPLSPFRPGDWRTHLRRRFRQALKAYQYTLLMPRLAERGLGSMPASVDDLYLAADPLPRLRWRARDALFYALAQRHIRLRVARLKAASTR